MTWQLCNGSPAGSRQRDGQRSVRGLFLTVTVTVTVAVTVCSIGCIRAWSVNGNAPMPSGRQDKRPLITPIGSEETVTVPLTVPLTVTVTVTLTVCIHNHNHK